MSRVSVVLSADLCRSGLVNNGFNGECVKGEPQVSGSFFQKWCSPKLMAWKFTPSSTATGGARHVLDRRILCDLHEDQPHAARANETH